MQCTRCLQCVILRLNLQNDPTIAIVWNCLLGLFITSIIYKQYTTSTAAAAPPAAPPPAAATAAATATI